MRINSLTGRVLPTPEASKQGIGKSDARPPLICTVEPMNPWGIREITGTGRPAQRGGLYIRPMRFSPIPAI